MPPQSRSKKSSKACGGAMKRARVLSSDEDSVQALTDVVPEVVEKGKRGRRRDHSETETNRTIADLKKKIKKSEGERKKLDTKLVAKKEQLKESLEKYNIQSRAFDRVKKEKTRLKKSNEKLEKEKQELETASKKTKKKMDGYRTKMNELEMERAKLESRVANLLLEGSSSSGASTSKQSEAAQGAAGGSGLFQDMMDNFRELAETNLQCAVCSEQFVDAVSINCGHTFCDYCIREWKKKKNNCPVCRTNISAINPCKVLDEYSDKVYEQFVSEGGKKARASLKEERAKLKEQQEKQAKARWPARRTGR